MVPGANSLCGWLRMRKSRRANAWLRIRNNDVADFFFKSARVRHQVAQGDGLGKRRPNLKIEIAVHIGIQVEFSLLHQLHHGYPGK